MGTSGHTSHLLLGDTNEQQFRCTGVRVRPVIPGTWTLRQNDCKFQACLGNSEPRLKIKRKQNKTTKRAEA